MICVHDKQFDMAQQIHESLAILEELKKKSTDEVTSFRVKCDGTEEERRRHEEDRRLRRFDAIEVDSIQCGRKQAKIDLSWHDIMQINVPQDLYASLQQQKAECHSVIAQKDRRIAEFSSDLRQKDEEFVKNVNENNRDVKNLIESMHKQYETMKKAYRDQLEEVEKSFSRERMELLDNQKQTVEELFATRKRKEEVEYIAERKDRLNKFRESLAESRARDLDQFSRVKLQHEKAIQELEQHWARMNATYHLNREKLDYNSQILAERHKEFNAITTAYRQRINRLRTNLSNCMVAYSEQQTELKNNNVKITNEYKRLTGQVKDLQRKLADFSSVADKQYLDAWTMHVEEVDDVILKAYNADKVICEQQLCLQWDHPKNRILREQAANDGLSEYGTSTFGGQSTLRGSDTKGVHDGANNDNDEDDKKNALTIRYSLQKYMRVMDLITSEAGFLMDSKANESIELAKKEGGDADALMTVRIEAMEQYLGISEAEDRDLLISFFNSGADEDDEEVHCAAEDCLVNLRLFLARKDELRLNNVAPTTSKGKKGKNQQSQKLDPSDEAAKREIERRWWEEKAKVLPEVTIRVWKALDAALQKYYKLLEDRAKVLEDNVRIQKQNEELMVLLDQYIHSRVNEELKIPPKHVIKVV